MEFLNVLRFQYARFFKRKTVWITFTAFWLLNLYCACTQFVSPQRVIENFCTAKLQPAYMNFSLEFITSLAFLVIPWGFALCVLPFADSYYTDRASGILPVLLSKIKKRHYYLAKLTVVFTGTTAVFFVPLVINQLVLLSFYPVQSHFTFGFCETVNQSFYNTFFNAFLPAGFVFSHPYMYNLFCAGLFAGFLGLASSLAYAVSLHTKKLRALHLLLPYALYWLFQIVDAAVNLQLRARGIPALDITFAKLFQVYSASSAVFLIVYVLIMLLLIGVLVRRKIYKDSL